MNDAFQPSPGTGRAVTAGAAAEITDLSKSDRQVVITNLDASVYAYVRIASVGNASATDFPVPPGRQVCLTKGPDATRISYFSAGTPALHICTGNGWLNN